jgi:hypothetical protein
MPCGPTEWIIVLSVDSRFSSPVIISEESFSSSAKSAKFTLQMCYWHSFCSGLSNFEIQGAETSFILKSSCKIFNTVASDILTSSAIIQTLIFQPAKSKISTFLKFSLVFALTGLPHLKSSWSDSPPHPNCLDRNFIGKYNGASSSYTRQEFDYASMF